MKYTNVNLNKPILSLAGKPLEGDPTLGRLLATYLVTLPNHPENRCKYFEWAMALHKGETLTLDTTDFERLKTLITNATELSILAANQLLTELKSCENSPPSS